MKYTGGQSPRKKKRGSGHTPARINKRTAMPIPRRREEGNSDFLKKHGLDKHSHPMNWFNALLPMTPKDNLEDPSKASVKGNRRTKFGVSNWSAYTNAKQSSSMQARRAASSKGGGRTPRPRTS